jgi:hypothetical protein
MLEYCKSCDLSQGIGGMKIMSLAKLAILLLKVPLMNWGLDFMGAIKPTSRQTRNKYILVVMNYATKWVEVRTL